MAYWKFICTWKTERECFARRLFGNDKKYDEEGNLMNVEKGDTLFLHRTINVEKRQGFLLGPFVARSDARMNIISEAWNHISQFPWQVQVGWDETVYSFDVEKMYEKSDHVPVEITPYAQSFNEVIGRYLLGKVKDGDPILSALEGD